MIATQHLKTSLTSLDAALALLLDGLGPVAPRDLPLAEALGRIAAEPPPLRALPAFDTAVVDGWVFQARDLLGASPYSPLPLARAPVWVEAGDRIPQGCDCVIDSDAVEQSGSMFHVSAEATPGQGVRRAGRDVAEGSPPIAAGRRIRSRDLAIARAAGLERLAVRPVGLRLINVPPADGNSVTARLIAESARAAGAEVASIEATSRDAASISGVFGAGPCDLLITVGGTGVGRTDAAIEALTMRGARLAHGIALQPGRTAAAGKLDDTPIIALPGAPDQALAGWWTMALPALQRLSGSHPGRTARLPLTRKIASSVGVAEIVLLKETDNAWMPLAVGDLALETIARADAWLCVPGGSEGFAAGAAVDAYMLRD